MNSALSNQERGKSMKVWLLMKSETQPQYIPSSTSGWPDYPEAYNVVHSAYLHREDAEKELNLLSASFCYDSDDEEEDYEEEKPEVYFWISGIEVQEV